MEDGVELVLAAYRKRINETPALLSLLYDVDLLPEQIVSMRGAKSMAAVVEAYAAGWKDGAACGRSIWVNDWRIIDTAPTDKAVLVYDAHLERCVVAQKMTALEDGESDWVYARRLSNALDGAAARAGLRSCPCHCGDFWGILWRLKPVRRLQG